MPALARLFSALLAQMEVRHWAALGVSAVLHWLVWWGFPTGGPPAPKPLSFEIALQAPEPEAAKRPRVKSKARADKHRPRMVKRKPRKADPLETAFKEEVRPPQTAPAVDLPRLETVSAQARERPASPVTPAPAPSPAQAQAATDADGGLSDPGVTSLASSGTGSPVGLVQTQAQGQSRTAAPGGGAQAAEAQGGVQVAASAGAQAGAGTFQASSGSGAGLNVAAGNGAQTVSRSDAPPLAGGEPKGARLAASGVAAKAASLVAGRGSLEAAPASPEAGRAAPSPAAGRGQSLASAQAGGVSASPLAPGPRQAGHGGRAGSAPASPAPSAGGGGPGPARLAGTTPHAQALVAGAGLPASRAGVAVVPAGGAVALRPGEPGSSPRFAVALAPVVTGLAPGQGGGRGGKTAGQMNAGQAGAPALPGGDASGGGSLSRAGGPGAGQLVAARSGGGNLQSAGGLSTPAGQSLGGGQAPRNAGVSGALQGVKVADSKVMRPDSHLQKLDVLAPSSFCPLPGHAQPDNRPKNFLEQIETPGYRTENPAFQYPILANIQGVSGKLIVRVQVMEDGSPGQILLKKSSGNGMLDRDAKEQIARWQFTPARKNGQAVTAWVDIPVEYRLSDNR